MPEEIIKDNIIVKRIIDAPVAAVWKAWTDPVSIMRWWGPKDWTSPFATIDLDLGSKYVFAMQAPPEQGGMSSYSSGVYTKIVPMERLEFTQWISDKDGNRIDPALANLPPDFPSEIRMSVEFKKIRENMTELTVTEYDWPVGQMYVYSVAGMNQSIDKLAESLA